MWGPGIKLKLSDLEAGTLTEPSCTLVAIFDGNFWCGRVSGNAYLVVAPLLPKVVCPLNWV